MLNAIHFELRSAKLIPEYPAIHGDSHHPLRQCPTFTKCWNLLGNNDAEHQGITQNEHPYNSDATLIFWRNFCGIDL